ncbi:hypothetical protein HDU96_011125 [Phlyctochytrium bullatum]|nr:hypothetical protein HDU96_011125 [Phlyctochytrium bullatum]
MNHHGNGFPHTDAAYPAAPVFPGQECPQPSFDDMLWANQILDNEVNQLLQASSDKDAHIHNLEGQLYQKDAYIQKLEGQLYQKDQELLQKKQEGIVLESNVNFMIQKGFWVLEEKLKRMKDLESELMGLHHRIAELEDQLETQARMQGNHGQLVLYRAPRPPPESSAAVPKPPLAPTAKLTENDAVSSSSIAEVVEKVGKGLPDPIKLKEIASTKPSESSAPAPMETEDRVVRVERGTDPIPLRELMGNTGIQCYADNPRYTHQMSRHLSGSRLQGLLSAILGKRAKADSEVTLAVEAPEEPHNEEGQELVARAQRDGHRMSFFHNFDNAMQGTLRWVKSTFWPCWEERSLIIASLV